MGACSLGQLDGEVDHGALPGRADLRVDGAASEDRGLAAAALFAERGLQPGGVVHGSVAALVLHRHGHGHQLALHPAQRRSLAPHGAAVSAVFSLDLATQLVVKMKIGDCSQLWIVLTARHY